MIRFSIVLEKNNVKAQVEFTLKVMERARVTAGVLVKKGSFLVNVLEFFAFFAGRCLVVK